MWKIVEEFPDYEVSSLGQIRNRGTKRILNPSISSQGYYKTTLTNKNVVKSILIHRLVALAFLDKPESSNLTVNHKDGNKLNNKVYNLEWLSIKDNLAHARETGLHKQVCKETHPNSKLTEEDVEFIRKYYKPHNKDFGGIALAKIFGVSTSTISSIAKGKHWKS